MPWLEVNPMDQKILFIADCLRATNTFSDICAQYGISRKTGYKWLKRYQSMGVDGLSEMSRKPLISPYEIPYTIRQAILKFRRCGDMVLGPKKIQTLLAQHYPNEPTPSKTTIYKVLYDAGLVEKRRRKRRVAPFPKPFAPVQSPNDLWSADFKGQFKLRSGVYCYPLTIMDHKSRYLICCKGVEGPRFEDTRQAFEAVFREYGLPQRIRTDNGIPFASRSAGGLSRLAVWWISLGILPERIDPGKPQQNGRHERMHRTLKQAATKPPESSFKTQQRRFDHFRINYNQNRPHEALQQQTPASTYRNSPRVYSEKKQEMTYPDYYTKLSVNSGGILNFRNKMIYVSHILEGYRVGLNEIDQGIFDVYFGPIRLGRLNERDFFNKDRPYISLKSVTHVS